MNRDAMLLGYEAQCSLGAAERALNEGAHVLRGKLLQERIVKAARKLGMTLPTPPNLAPTTPARDAG